MPALDRKAALELVRRRHPEWTEHQRRWRWLADSLEGGNRYRQADYAVDPTASSAGPWATYGFDPATSQPYTVAYKQIVDRNLVPHLRETGTAGQDIYALRLARTPVPRLVERAIESHLAKVYGKEVRRDGPPALQRWWADADGRGADVDRWVRETFAPLFLVLGQLDVQFDRPAAPAGARVETRADVLALGLDAAVASVVLPENLVWWRLDPRGARYEEVLVFERDGPHYRHWTAGESNAYDGDGKFLPDLSRAHPFGVVPVVRVFDRRLARARNVGKSRYEGVAELNKSIYNLESERILSDVQSSHAQLMGPEDFLQQDAEIPIGPDNVLPKKKVVGPSGAVSYEGFEYLDPPKGAQEALRQHILDQRDEADRDASLLKPAGMTASATTAQSGISKVADQQDGNALLAAVAESLEGAEETLAALALVVLAGGAPGPAAAADAAVTVTYPRQFDLFSAGDLAQALDDLQRIAATAGALPETEGELIHRLIEAVLPGLTDDRLGELRDEVTAYLARAAAAPENDPAGAVPNPEADTDTTTTPGPAAGPAAVLASPTPS